MFLPVSTDVFVTGLEYRSVPAGRYISVMVHGKLFSSDMDVLVNNIPLRPSSRLTDPPDPAKANQSPQDGDVQGDFEVVSPNLIALRFRCDRTFIGIPELTLISPGNSARLNELPLIINGNDAGTLADRQASFEVGADLSGVFFLPDRGKWKGVERVRFTTSGVELDVTGLDLKTYRVTSGSGNQTQELMRDRDYHVLRLKNAGLQVEDDSRSRLAIRSTAWPSWSSMEGIELELIPTSQSDPEISIRRAKTKPAGFAEGKDWN